jgi:peptide/nickel transport system substrate-binding protein
MKQAAALFLIGVLFAGVGGPATASGDPQTLRIALDSTPNTLNGLTTTQVIEGFVASLVFDGVVRATPDGKLAPALAVAVPSAANGGISRDGRTITYRLRRGVRWHDGTPLGSADVAFSQRAHLDPNNNVTNRDPYRFVARLETPRDDLVVVHLTQPYAPFVAEWFPSGSLGTVAILPAHLLARERELNDVAFNAAPVGTGPFVFDHWDRGREILLRANDDYFLGKPRLRRIIIQLMSDENSRNVALQTGETDWSLLAGTTSARQFIGSADVVTRLLSTNAYFGLTVQTQRPALSDKRVRRAVVYALDRAAMVAKISGDFAAAASADIWPAVWAYDPEIRPLPFDPDRSRALLASAGWRSGPGGMLERDGKPLSLLLVYVAGSPASTAYALQIQSMLRAVGIDVELKPQQANLLFAPLAEHGTDQSGTFDLELSSFYNTADPNDRKSFACSAIVPNGFNSSRWCNAEYDRVTNDALRTTDRARRKRDYARASQILLDEAPEVFLYWPKDIELMRRGVHVDDGSNLIERERWSKDP